MRAELGIVAALPAELAGLRRRLRGRQAIAMAVTGDGSARAAAAVCRFLDTHRPVTLLGVGVAGGLTPAAGRGELIVADRIVGSGGTLELTHGGTLREALVAAGARRGVVVSSPTIVSTRRSKQALAEGSGIAPEVAAVVDLESEAWARAAIDRGITPTIARLVLDPVEESLPVDLARFQAPGGAVRRGAIAAWLVLRPHRAVELLKLGGRVRRAGERIGACIAQAVERMELDEP